ncbi:hypothetical protein [Sodalis sp.]|uniref:hypothetical protein n=1 Tax=Sodalis sp. (in: enterobacteria) TaxID=1898979 RepID=UPI003872CE17
MLKRSSVTTVALCDSDDVLLILKRYRQFILTDEARAEEAYSGQPEFFAACFELRD